MTTPVPSIRTGLFTPEALADPYPLFHQLRDRSPLFDEDSQMWCLLRFSDVYAALRDHTTFSSQSGGQESGGEFRLVLITDDPPRHTRFRHLVNKVFTPRRVAELRPWLESVSNELLDDLGAGEVEVVSRYTVPLPVRTIARLLGIPGEEYETFKRWTDAFLAVESYDSAGPERQQDLMNMLAYFGKMIAARREQGAADLITALVQAEVDGERLQEWEILGFAVLLLIAGNETTTNLMGNMLNVLAHRPDLWEQLRNDRSLVEPVIEETLRYESPVRMLFRNTTRPVEIGGVTIPERAEVAVFFGAANRDPAEFPNPDEFRLDRDLLHHVAFGYGIHFCLGAALARTEATVTHNNFLDRYPRIAPGSRPGERQTVAPIVFGFRNLPLTLG